MTRAELEEYIRYRTTTASDDEDVMTAIRWEMNRVYTTLPVSLDYKLQKGQVVYVQDAEVLVLPTDLRGLRQVQGGGIVLRPISMDEYTHYESTEYEQTEPSGQPTYYTQVSASNIWVWPKPSAAYAGKTVTFTYVPAVPAMTLSTSEPDEIPEDFHLMIAEYAIEAVFLADEDPGIAAAAKVRGDTMFAAYSQYLAKRQGLPNFQRRVRGFK